MTEDCTESIARLTFKISRIILGDGIRRTGHGNEDKRLPNRPNSHPLFRGRDVEDDERRALARSL